MNYCLHVLSGLPLLFSTEKYHRDFFFW